MRWLVVGAMLAAKPAMAQDGSNVDAQGRKPVMQLGLGLQDSLGSRATARMPEHWVREALPPVPRFDLFAPDGPLLSLHRERRIDTLGAVRLDLGIDTDGSVTCALAEESSRIDQWNSEVSRAELAALACEELEARGPWTPALTQAGERLATDYGMSLSFRTRRPWSREEEEGFVGPQIAPAPPMPGPPPFASINWLPNSTMTRLRLTELPMADAAPADDVEGWAGLVMMRDGDGSLQCRVVRPSDSKEFERRACKAAQRAQGVAPESDFAWHRYAMVMAVPGEDGPTFVTQAERFGDAAIRPDVLTILQEGVAARDGKWDALALRGSVDESGAMQRCIIAETTGNDEADLFVCRTLTGGIALTPRSDLFGRPMRGFIRYFADGEERF